MTDEAIELCRPSLSRNSGTLDCINVSHLLDEVASQPSGFTPL